MIFVDSPYPSGTIAIARGELARYTDFDDSLDKLKIPRGSEIIRVKGPSVSRNRNTIVSDFFKTGSWLCFLDDDQVIPPDTIFKLLSHNLPIVGALYSTKSPPYIATAHKARRADGKYIPWGWSEIATQTSPLPCVGAGTGCMVIQRHVFEKITQPWFHAMEYTDDIYFCQQAIAAGFPIYVDQQAPIGHTSTHNVYPDLTVGGVRLQMMWLNLQIPDDAEDGAAHLEGAQES